LIFQTASIFLLVEREICLMLQKYILGIDGSM